MNRQTQGLLLAFLGAVLLRLSLSDAYLRYVTEWMRWPIAASGVILLLLALGPILREPREGEHSHGVPVVTWLLVLPGLVTFVFSPPELGSFLAERRAGDATVAEPAVLSSFDESETVPLQLQEFIWRAQDGGDTLVGQPVLLSGFVSEDDDDQWYVTRMAIGCCAADAVSFRVQVEGVPEEERPSRDQWVEVTGTYVEGTGTGTTESPSVAAEDLTVVPAPAQTYE